MFQTEQTTQKSAYFQSKGTFLNRVCEYCPTPIFMLTTTKMDKIKDKNVLKDNKFKDILSEVMEHLTFIAENSKTVETIFLVDEIVQSSSLEASEKSLKLISDKLSEICIHKDLLDVKIRTIPMTWKTTLNNVKDKPKVLISEIQHEFEKICKEFSGSSNGNVDSERMCQWKELIEKFRVKENF